MNRILAENIARNEGSRDCWEMFGPHRWEVTRRLVRCCRSPNDRLCVLGAGNCNDLALDRLADAFQEVHLVDLDGAALAGSIARQQFRDRKRVYLHGGIDVTGVAHRLANWAPDRQPTQAEVDDCLRHTDSSVLGLPAPFDVVASVCLLTQLIDAVSLTLGASHPRFLDLVSAIRRRHLCLLLELLVPGGRAILVTDVVSSDTCPNLSHIPPADLPKSLAELINQRNFFTGVNPAVLHSIFTTDQRISPQVDDVQVTTPWLWDFKSRVYAVYAIVVQVALNHRRRPPSQSSS